MKLYMVAIRDIKADLWARPTYTPSLGASVRDFGDQCQKQDEQNLLYTHPEDFELYHIGEFDDSNGKIEQLQQPKQIAAGSNYKRT